MKNSKIKNKKLVKISALSTIELEKLFGGLGSYTGGTDSKDCTSGLGSGESNTDYDDGIIPIIPIR